jgi:hypothetical protein
VERPAYNVEEGTLTTYATVYVHDIHLRYNKTLHKPPIVIEEKEKEK